MTGGKIRGINFSFGGINFSFGGIFFSKLLGKMPLKYLNT